MQHFDDFSLSRVASVALAAGALAFSTTAEAQYAAVSPPSQKAPGVTAPAQGGGFLIGADDCASPHTNAGIGPVVNVPFDLCTATTGTTGQSTCFFFGAPGINNDVWFDWTASATLDARFHTCGQTAVDTKLAVWVHNGSSSCPVTMIDCNDDTCNLQSTVVWPVTAGTTYTFQLGTFPGAACGSGTFSVEQIGPTPCGQYDDGTAENALGLTAGGEIAWIHSFDCLATIRCVETTYGSALFPGSVSNGAASRIAVYADTAGLGDPTLGHALLEVVDTVVVSGSTGILHPIAFSTAHVIPNGNSFVLASADHLAGEFPGPMDQNNPVPQAWVAGSTAGPGTMDLVDLNNNSLPPLQMQAIGFPAAWILRAHAGPDSCLGTRLCFGDGSGTQCPCNNNAPGQTGCLNGLGVGAELQASGSQFNLVLTATDVTAQPGLFFMGDSVVAGGNGAVFGDGLRCCAQNVVRLEIVVGQPPAPTTVSSTVPITVPPGTSQCFQYWYRTPGATSACGNFFNLTNAVVIP